MKRFAAAVAALIVFALAWAGAAQAEPLTGLDTHLYPLLTSDEGGAIAIDAAQRLATGQLDNAPVPQGDPAGTPATAGTPDTVESRALVDALINEPAGTNAYDAGSAAARLAGASADAGAVEGGSAAVGEAAIASGGTVLGTALGAAPLAGLVVAAPVAAYGYVKLGALAYHFIFGAGDSADPASSQGVYYYYSGHYQLNSGNPPWQCDQPYPGTTSVAGGPGQCIQPDVEVITHTANGSYLHNYGGGGYPAPPFPSTLHMTSSAGGYIFYLRANALITHIGHASDAGTGSDYYSPGSGTNYGTAPTPTLYSRDIIRQRITSYLQTDPKTAQSWEHHVETIVHTYPPSGPTVDPANPTITIPAPLPNEVGTAYVSRVQTLGFSDVVTNTLNSTTLDPSHGPNEVTSVSPAPGTQVAPQTQIRVDVNPADAPNVAPSSNGALFTPPTVPTPRLPSMPTPCTVFPFGIPCWIANQLGGLVGTATAPNFSISLPWDQTLAVDFNNVFGANLSDIMAIVRPVLLFLSFLGLVVWLGGMAMGGSTGGGGGSEGEE